MNNNDRYEVQVGANISSFKQKMKEMISVSKTTSDEVQKKMAWGTGKITPDMTAQDIVKNFSGVYLEETTDGLKDIEDEAENAGNGLEEMFSGAAKNGKKFLLSLFSIRTAWALISKGANQYLQENETLNQSVQLTASLLGNTLAPIIKVVVNAAQYAMIVVSELIRLFTGYDAIAGTITNANNNIASSAKAANKQLAGFDTISNLSSNSGTTSSDITAMGDALGSFQEKVDKVRKIFEQYEEPIKAATIALGIFAGANMLSKITNMIGTIGTAGAAGTGLAGVGSALAYIAAYSVIAIEIYYNIKVWKEIIDLADDTVEGFNNAAKSTNKVAEANKELNESYIEEYKNGERSAESMKSWNKTLGEQITLTSQQGNQTRNSLSLMERMIGTNKKNTETLSEYNEALYNDSLLLAENSNVLKLNGTELETTRAKIINAQAAIQRNANAMKEGSAEYKAANDMIATLQTTLDKLDGNYTANVNVNTTTATNNANTLIDKIKNFVSGKHTAKITVDGDTSSLRKTLSALTTTTATGVFGSSFTNGVKWLLNSFDVGTNYVPNDQLAMVHKGEMIVPAKYNPSTSGIGGGAEVVTKLNQLINVLENKEFNAYLDGNKITDRVISGINSKSRIAGGSVIL